jgi:hypothetical protein
VGAQAGDGFCQDLEPCPGAEGEQDSLVRNAL